MPNTISAQRGTRFIRRAWCVLKAWADDPSQVATICPSSTYVTEHLADRECVRQATRIIELGPGAGGTTEALLSFMRRDARLLTIEKTEAFAEALHEIIDPRLSVVIADASDLIDLVVQREFGQADVVVSGIPFSSLSTSAAKRIMQSIHEVLCPGGTFIAYQLKSDVRDYARPLFGPSKTEVIPMNLPPLQADVWKKVENDCDRNHSLGSR